MASSHLSNYLRTHRKRLGFSQEEIAYLLGTQTGEKVCRHEKFARKPDFETAMAYEAIFQRSTSELFAGYYQKIEKDVRARAKRLITRAKRLQPTRQNLRKLHALAQIAGIKSKES